MTGTPPPADNLAEAKRQRESRLLGMIIMTMSGLVAGLCGLCTLAFTSQSTGSGQGLGDFIALIALVIGGVPTAVGVAGFVAGLTLYRSGGPQWAKDDPRWIARRRRRRLAIAVPVFAIAAIIALWNFGGQILFGAAGFGIPRWMFLRVDPADRETALRHQLIGGGLLAGVAVFGLWLRDAAMLFEGVGFALALWLYRFGGRE